MAVEYIGAGSVETGNAFSSPEPPWHGSYQAGDIGIMFIETRNYSVNIPTGWTELVNYGIGIAGNTQSTRLTVCYKIASSSETAPTVTASGYPVTAVIVVVRGVDSENPIIDYNGQPSFAPSISANRTIPAADSGAVETLFLAAMVTSGNYTGSGLSFSNLTTREADVNILIGSTVDSGTLGTSTSAITQQSVHSYAGVIMAFNPATEVADTGNFFQFFF